ncbi:glycosylphosphatidylinositol anchor biosynthesis [Cladophialophora chaetospira]|uniref:Mannosyltransferase n=1 Tax=Cladophialophora chaetospira TaxID=386627 RepID=A0AA38X1B0_9EURO|nr:glycosylphosphatidylinositol anchor biosynthesis [Cladophialophora chaetospira]
MSTHQLQAEGGIAHSTNDAKDSATKLTLAEIKPTRWPQLDALSVLFFLIGLRLLNALTIQTFFQPDEYFQALEPAWRWAFGSEAGAWITWEWKHSLRSAIHPAIFGMCYDFADSIAALLDLGHHTRAELLLVAPKTLQAIFAALGDFYTWTLAGYIYGAQSTATLSTLLLTIASPWQWFCSTRTFSNSLETTLTICALYNWPWHWAQPLHRNGVAATDLDDHGVRVRERPNTKSKATDEVTRLRRSLLYAAVAVILRPTNILIWMILTWSTFVSSWSGPVAEYRMFGRETVLCGSVILLFSTFVDRIFYEAWVCPPLNFLRVNVFQSLASFYGNNDWHYYISQGYPLLLTTALPFALIGLCRVWSTKHEEAKPVASNALRLLSKICIIVPAAFSLISHKEVRFIYPLLPALHIIAASPLAAFLQPFLGQSSASPPFGKRVLLFFLLSLNVGISYYTSQVHNSGLIPLTSYLRSEFESTYLTSAKPMNMTIGTLMPCHSTPWRSHLLYQPTSTLPGIRGWALTCEPPLDLNTTEKEAYLDEADLFYANPALWVKKNMSRHIPTSQNEPAPGVYAPHHQSGKIETIPRDMLAREREEQYWAIGEGRKPWPDYLIFFAQLEEMMQAILRGSGYAECQRLFNSHWHDDWRRQGDVVVWCLDVNKQQLQQERKAHKDGRKAEIKKDEPGTAGEAGAGGQNILGAAKAKANEGDKEKGKEPFRRVVEKPYWKHREPEED